jgi:hypothetical protein
MIGASGQAGSTTSLWPTEKGAAPCRRSMVTHCFNIIREV